MHTFMHIFTAESTTQGTSQLVERVRVRSCLAQEHVETQLGGAGDRTSYLSITSQPALASETRAANQITRIVRER